uniref:Uncharacterized protein n=1 Tax=Schistosoma japonicum TaxID=6182 RepID=Q5C5X0_SCHJA|nr:unknown [Schistosoma japonicum]
MNFDKSFLLNRINFKGISINLKIIFSSCEYPVMSWKIALWLSP